MSLSELSLFTGTGGGCLATQQFLKWRTVGYVEWDKHCQRVLESRIRGGHLQQAPVFGDIQQFIDQGYAESYQGMVGVVTAGFPCQPFTHVRNPVGGAMANSDSRNRWPETLEVISIVRPPFAFLENVPDLRTGKHGYFREGILEGLARVGYDAKWTSLSAQIVGAPTAGTRLWILAWREDMASSVCPGLQGSLLEELVYQDNGKKGNENAPPACSPVRSDWWSAEPQVERVDHGTPERVGQLRAIGNSWIPQLAALAWATLTGERPWAETKVADQERTSPIRDESSRSRAKGQRRQKK